MNTHQRRILKNRHLKRYSSKPVLNSVISFSFLTFLVYFYAWCFEIGYFNSLGIDTQFIKIDIEIFVHWLITLSGPIIFLAFYHLFFTRILRRLKTRFAVTYFSLLTGSFCIPVYLINDGSINILIPLILLFGIIAALCLSRFVEKLFGLMLFDSVYKFLESRVPLHSAITITIIFLSGLLGYAFFMFGATYGRCKRVYYVDKNSPKDIVVRVQGERIIFTHFNSETGKIDGSVKIRDLANMDLITSRTNGFIK
jgi:uncharacterized membrane protein YdcZ (DUF606 family)